MKNIRNVPKNLSLALIIGSVCLSSIAQLLFKLAMMRSLDGSTVNAIMSWSIIVPLGIGIGCYAVSLIFWMIGLISHDLSFVYPLLSLSYVLVYILAVVLPPFHEEVSVWKTVGIASIVGGVALITRTYGSAGDDP